MISRGYQRYTFWCLLTAIRASICEGVHALPQLSVFFFSHYICSALSPAVVKVVYALQFTFGYVTSGKKVGVVKKTIIIKSNVFIVKWIELEELLQCLLLIWIFTIDFFFFQRSHNFWNIKQKKSSLCIHSNLRLLTKLLSWSLGSCFIYIPLW